MGVRFINYSVIGFSLSLALGIVAGYYFNSRLLFQLSPKLLFNILIALLIVLILILWYGRNKLRPLPLFGIAVYILLFVVGLINYTIRLPESTSQHYSHRLVENSSVLLQLKIKEVLKPDRYNTKYIVEAQAINSKKVSGKILMYLQTDTLSTEHGVDKVLLVSTSINTIRQPLNPHQFNYATYMKTLGVYGEIRIQPREIITLTEGNQTLKGFSEKIRRRLIYKLKKNKLSTEERSILQALVLGERSDISKELYDNYAAAGAMHILAVSGLHVGILYVMLLFIGRPLTYLKHGALIRSICIVLTLWCFALLAGMSPSVVRAVTMFSFFTFATAIKRTTNSINTLFLSFFLLLILKPNWLFHVGFQLSYLAVFFILWLQPNLFKLYRPKFYIDRLFWGIITVTIAAQLGVMPLSLYYFNQFPGLFFITNMVVLPVLGIVLAGGLLVVIFAAFDWLPDTIAEGYNYILKTLNTFINWVANQHSFLFEDIPFSKQNVLATYFIIITSIVLCEKFNPKRLKLFLLSVCVFITISIVEKKRRSHHEFIVFHKSRTTLLGYKQSNKLTVFKNDTATINYPLTAYRIGKSINNFSEQKIPYVFRYKNMRILVLDSLGTYPKDTKIDMVILSNNPKVNLDRLLSELNPKQLVADGSNYSSYVNRWRKSCINKKLPFHHTGTKGAFTLK